MTADATTVNPLERYADAVNVYRTAQRDLKAAEQALVAFTVLARSSGRAKAGAAICGTDSGYYRHRRQSQTPPCEPCLHAHRVAERDRYQQRKTT